MKVQNKFIDTTEADVISFLPNGEGIPSVLDQSMFILYLWMDIHTKKLKHGEVVEHHNVSPIEAFINRYNSTVNSVGTVKGQWKLLAVLIFSKSSFPNRKNHFDCLSRDFVDSFHYTSPKDTQFYCPGGRDETGGNNEEIVGLDWGNLTHKRRFLSLLKQWSGINTYDIRYNFTFRHDTQKRITKKLLDTLLTYHLCLFNAHTAFGKSTLVPHIISVICKIGDVAMFTTPIGDTLDSLIRSNTTHNHGKPITIFTDEDLRDKNLLNRIETARKTSIVLLAFTVQNVRYTEDTTEPVEDRDIRKKFSFLIKLHLKLWVRDEYHIQYNGTVTKQVFKKIVSEYTLDLTATIYKMSASTETYKELYTNDEMVLCRDCFWAWVEKVDGNLDYQKFPWIRLKEINFGWASLPHYINIMYGGDKRAGFNPVKIFETNNGALVHLTALITQHKMMFNNQMPDGTVLSGKINPFLVSDDTERSPGWLFLMRLPEGMGGVTAQERNEIVKNSLNGKDINAVYYTAADYLDELDSGKSPLAIVEGWYKNANNKNVVIITHEQLCTGTDLVPLVGILLYDKISSPDIIVQLFGRLTREWFNDDVERQKTDCTVYLMCPGMATQVSEQLWKTVCAKTTVPKERRKLYDCVAPSCYIDGVTHTISFDEAGDNFNRSMVQKTIDGEITPSFFDKFPGLREKVMSLSVNPLKVSKTPKAPKVQITQGNGSSTVMPPVTPATPKTSEKTSVKEISQFRVMVGMVECVPTIQCAERHSDITSLWNGKLASLWFEPCQLNLMHEALTIPEFKEYLEATIKEINISFTDKNLCDIVLEGKHFRPQPWLSNKGMVFMPVKWTEKELIFTIDRKTCETILVINALNGVLPLLLKKMYPHVRIVCLEYFRDFIPMLKELGFEVYLYGREPKEIKNMKFDLGVMNPPYNDNMDLKFIKLMTERCNEFVAVHPAISTITRSNIDGGFDDIKSLLNGHIKSMQLFNGNPVFNIGLFYPCQVVHIAPGKSYKSFPIEYDCNGIKEHYSFTSMFDITKWGNITEYYSLEKKVLEYCKRHRSCLSAKNEGKHSLGCAKVRGNVSYIDNRVYTDDFFTFIPNNRSTKSPHRIFNFKTTEEKNNFEKYLKSEFARFCLSLAKNSAHCVNIQWKCIPYFPSYTQEWTKARITKELGITQKEWVFIEKVIPSYYD
jgi:hypothetical protein